MGYTYRVFNLAAEIERSAWEEVCSSAEASIFLDLRFVMAVEAAMTPSCRFWYVLIYQEDGRPVACAGMTAMNVDLTDFGDPRATWILKQDFPILSRLRRMNILFCSLPGSPGDKSIAISPAAESREVLELLDNILVKISFEEQFDAIIFKEFTPTDIEWLDPLRELGYQRIEIPPMHLFDSSFQDFSQYCCALKTKYRQQINRSIRKISNRSVCIRIISDYNEIMKRYSPEVHSLYCNMVRRSDLKIEVLPREYYLYLAKYLKGNLEMIALILNDRIIAFGWCIHERNAYHMMYAGLDYDLNSELDLYFNLMYAGFDRALRRRVRRIHVGQTATAFKSRMGCISEPRYIYVKGIGFFMSRVFRYGSNLLVIKKPSYAPAHVFKRQS